MPWSTHRVPLLTRTRTRVSACGTQIAEKKYRKDMEKQREQDELLREEARLRSDQEKLKQAYEEV